MSDRKLSTTHIIIYSIRFTSSYGRNGHNHQKDDGDEFQSHLMRQHPLARGQSLDGPLKNSLQLGHLKRQNYRTVNWTRMGRTIQMHGRRDVGDVGGSHQSHGGQHCEGIEKSMGYFSHL